MANEVIDFEQTTDPIQAQVALNAAFDGTTQTGLKAESAANVTTNINGQAITDIFESDGVTAKKATLAEAVKGDTRFQVSGNTVEVFPLDGNAGRTVQKIVIVVPVEKQLRLKGARYTLRGDYGMTARLKVVGTNTWTSSTFSSEELNIDFVLANSGTIELEFIIFNDSAIFGSIEPAAGWWVDLAIEDV